MTMHQLFTKQVIYTGSANAPPKPIVLRTGDLQLLYQSGNLQSIFIGETEILHSIYSAVRDRNWGTLLPVIKYEQIETSGNGFSIAFACSYEQDVPVLEASYLLEGCNNRIRCSMNCKALAPFYKNRIGFCVNHPIAPNAGEPCRIVHPDGSIEQSSFPLMIPPWQPFSNIRSMTWPIGDIGEAALTFEGDVFESEDQRNWTDMSYKTYSTPLGLPFPVLLEPNQTIQQAVELRVKLNHTVIKVDSNYEKRHEITLDKTEQGISMALPEIGVERSSESNSLTEEELATLGAISFYHYHIDCRLYEPAWKNELNTAIEESDALKWPLEITLIVSKTHDAELAEFIAFCEFTKMNVRRISIIDRTNFLTPENLNPDFLEKLRHRFPKAEIGGGTYAYFAELNRSSLKLSDYDFVIYSISPQVHEFDDQSLVENLQGQVETMLNAKHRFNKPVSIGAITMKQRTNFVSTAPEKPVSEGELPRQADVRQMSLFCAAWTLASIKRLAQAGTHSLTYYQTVGMRGIIQGVNPPTAKDFHSFPGMVFPVYHLFREVMKYPGCRVIPSTSSDPHLFDGLALESESCATVIIVNLSNRELTVYIPKPGKCIEKTIIDEDNFTEAVLSPHSLKSQQVIDSEHNSPLIVNLKPYSLHVYRFQKILT